MLFPKKLFSNILAQIFEKNQIFAYCYFVNDGKMTVDIAGEGA